MSKFIPQIPLNLTTVEVNSETRALRATWIPELSKEITNFTGGNLESEALYIRRLLTEKFIPPTIFDAEEELVALLSKNIAKEIDKEIISTLYKDAFVFTKELIIEKKEKNERWSKVHFPKVKGKKFV